MARGQLHLLWRRGARLLPRFDPDLVALLTEKTRDWGANVHLNERTSSWYSSRRVGETVSGYKTLVEEGTDRILGTHLLGGQAEEVMNLFTSAIRSGIPAQNLKDMLFAYPSDPSDIAYMLQEGQWGPTRQSPFVALNVSLNVPKTWNKRTVPGYI